MSADRKTILLVDDDIDARDLVAEALARLGYRVELAANGREAINMLAEGASFPDAIVLDLMMPEMDGWMFRAAQRKIPGAEAIPVVAFTAYALTRDAEEQLAAAAVLGKPLQLPELARTLEAVLGGAPGATLAAS